MLKPLRIFFALIILIVFTNSCNSFDKAMCGEPQGKQKAFIDSINLQYKNEFILNHIPCYDTYMRINLKLDYKKELIDSIESSYARSINWAEFHVYDNTGKLIRGNTGSM